MLSDLYPLLRTVQPAELNQTLNALATALEGRGDADRPEPRDRRQLPQAAQPADPGARRGPPADRVGLRHLRRRAAADRATILRNTVTTTGTLEDREAQLHALFDDVTDVLRRPRRTFLDDNGDNLIRLGEVSRAQLRVLARYSTEFPCLLGGIVNAGKLQAEAFRGFTLHIVLETLPNQPRGYTAADQPALRRGPRPDLPAPAQPAVEPVQPGAAASPTSTTASTRPTGKGTSRVGASYDAARERRRLRRLRRHARGVRPARRPCSRPALGTTADRGARPRRPAASARWPAGSGGDRCDDTREAPRQEDHRRPRQAAHLHGGDHARHRRAGRHDRQPLLRRARTTTRPSSPTPPASSRATTSGSPASRSAPSRTSRSPTAPARWSPSRVDDSTRAHRGHPRDDPYRNLVGQRYIALTQEVGDTEQARRGRHDPDRADLAGARPDGAVQRLQAALPGAQPRPTSTSCPTRSSRSSRARAARSRACSPTPRR